MCVVVPDQDKTSTHGETVLRIGERGTLVSARVLEELIQIGNHETSVRVIDAETGQETCVQDGTIFINNGFTESDKPILFSIKANDLEQ